MKARLIAKIVELGEDQGILFDEYALYLFSVAHLKRILARLENTGKE